MNLTDLTVGDRVLMRAVEDDYKPREQRARILTIEDEALTIEIYTTDRQPNEDGLADCGAEDVLRKLRDDERLP